MSENKIITLPASRFRAMAREKLAGNWSKVFFGALIYFLLADGVSLLLDAFFYYRTYLKLPTGDYVPYNVGYAGELYEILVSGALACGLMMFLLAYFRSGSIKYGLTLEGFGMFGRSLALFLIYSLKILAWSLLFGIPGIVASYRYSQCFYFRVDNPQFSAMDCINASKQVMQGNKAKLFALDLSFIGWYLLAAIPYSIITGSGTDDSAMLTNAMLTIMASLPQVLVFLYRSMAETAFYELLTGNLVAAEESLPGSDGL